MLGTSFIEVSNAPRTHSFLQFISHSSQDSLSPSQRLSTSSPKLQVRHTRSDVMRLIAWLVRYMLRQCDLRCGSCEVRRGDEMRWECGNSVLALPLPQCNLTVFLLLFDALCSAILHVKKNRGGFRGERICRTERGEGSNDTLTRGEMDSEIDWQMNR